MALLRLESHELYSCLNAINSLIAPHELGQFHLSDTDKNRFSTSLPGDVSLITSLIPDSLNSYCLQKGLSYSGAACLSHDAPESLKQRVAESALPHLDLGDEVHICFGGSLIVYFGLQKQCALVLQLVIGSL